MLVGLDLKRNITFKNIDNDNSGITALVIILVKYCGKVKKS
jgi:hypothetical protein